MNNKRIYFDHSASTPVDKEALKAMQPYFSEIYGNPSSLHNFGQAALAGVDQARAQAAEFLNCSPDEIIFTSGATESDNLAIKGLAKGIGHINLSKLHFITSKIEHDAVLEPFRELEKDGAAVTYLDVDKRGVVLMDKFKDAIRDNTVLVSVMYVNSEVGSIQPVREIGKTVLKTRAARQKEWERLGAAKKAPRPLPIYFHTDATQAVNFFNCDVEWNYIDLLSLSAHKIYGPKGAGALYVRSGVPLKGIQTGGHHEKNLRSGTLNTPGIIGLGATLNLLGRGDKGETSANQKKTNNHIAKLRDRLVAGVIKNIPDVVLNTDREISTPAHAHFSFLGVEGESILISLDLEGVAVSTGSACASGSLKASHVLLAMGIKTEVAHNSIRFSLGKHNTAAEVDRVLKVLPPIMERLRKMNPLYNKEEGKFN